MKTLSPLLSTALAALLTAIATGTQAGPIRSVGSMAFADAGTLLIADWRGGEIHALQLPAAAAAEARQFNLKNISAPIAKALHTQPDKLRFEDMAFRPGAELAYISLSIEQPRGLPQPALVSVNADGKVAVLQLEKLPRHSAAIGDKPSSDKMFWNQVPAATYTVTDMVFHDNKLYVAGLSNASFASTLRVYDYPFTPTGKTGVASSSIEMYHAVHDQVETRAPIGKMVIATLNGEPSLIAAYTCTPLVTVPLNDLKDGAHVVGKTVAELGWGSAPVDMVAFDAGQGPVVLLTNSHKSADMMALSDIAEASARPGLSKPIEWPASPYLGVKAIPVPLAGIAQLGTQDKEFLGALRRNEASGAMELVSIRKGAFLRLSDFVNEYDFADYRYAAKDPFRGLHQQLRGDEGFPNLAARAAP
jgi:hypothetical protein